MAIPEGRMSTTPVIGVYSSPEERRVYAKTSYERGPIAIEDVSEGLLYQNWALTWNPITGELTVLPETIGESVVVHTVADLVSVSFTFDQNARITIAYTTDVSSYLYWYDTSLGEIDTLDLGVEVITPAILLDDKRSTQNVTNDILLWYTRLDVETSTYWLFMRRQRDRFSSEFMMDSGLNKQYIHNIGMTNELRVQMTIHGTVPRIPYV